MATTELNEIMGVALTKKITLGSKEYIVAPMSPILLGELIAHIKGVKRKEIASNAISLRTQTVMPFL